MVPKKIQSHFEITGQKMDGDNTLVEGTLMCCNAHEFEVRIAGEVKRGLLSKMYLLPTNENLAVEVCCKKCGKVISVFNGRRDGYDQIEAKCSEDFLTRPFVCKRCSQNHFSVKVKYEYPDVRELMELGITEMDNAFTWIWITLECNQCGKRYHNFVDFETA